MTQLFFSATAGVLMLDHDGNIYTADRAAEETFGYGSCELQGSHINALLRQQNGSVLNGKLAGLSGEALGRRKDGSTLPVDVTVRETGGNHASYIAIVRDIAKFKEVQEAAETRLRLTALAAEIGVALTHGQSLEDLLQRCSQALVDHLGAAFARIWTLNKRGDTLDLRASAGLYTHLDGPHAHVPVGMFKIGLIAQERLPHLTNSVLTDPRVGDKAWAQREGMVAFAGHPLIVDGRLMGVMAMFARHKLSDEVLVNLGAIADGIALGIDRFQCNEDLRQAKEAAEAAVIAKSQFLGTMSHEIRTPLNAIIGMASLLSKTQVTAEQKQFLGIILDSGEALLTVINDILDFSKIDAGKLELENCAFNLQSLVEETLDLVASMAEEKGLEVFLTFQKSVPLGVMGDPTRLRQILLNLLSNAIKFTEKGEITVVVEPESAADGGLRIRFTVQDTGIGISEEAQSRLFTSFSQADTSTTRKYGGTGLGLAICKRLVELMGGQIGVVSEHGSGSSFWFDVALAEAPDLARPAPPRKLAKKKVMVVDDSSASRRILSEQLAFFGMHVTSFSSGKEALGWLATKQETPNLAILDLHMPELDGLTLAGKIHELAGFQSLPVMILTSFRDYEAARKAQDCGIKTYLTKPIREAQLLTAIAELLGVGETQAASTETRPEAAKVSRRILVAEDNAVNQVVIRTMLQKEGHAVDIAESGRRAIALWETQPYDLIFMDCQMADMDGFEATAEIRRLEAEGDRTPIIALTANAMEEDRQKCLEAGMDEHLTKPIRLAQLLSAVEHWGRAKISVG
jgi:PAS domain S-box-containing protein